MAEPAAVMPDVAGPIRAREFLVSTGRHQDFAAEHLVTEPATLAPEPVAAAEPAPGEHPLGALRGFRMQVALVEPAFGGLARDLGRFLAAYIVVAALVLGLIVAFLALTANAGSAGA